MAWILTVLPVQGRDERETSTRRASAAARASKRWRKYLRIRPANQTQSETGGNEHGQGRAVADWRNSENCHSRSPERQSAQQLTERDLALAPHDEVDPPVRVLGVVLGSDARIIAADDARAGAPRADEIDDPFGRTGAS